MRNVIHTFVCAAAILVAGACHAQAVIVDGPDDEIAIEMPVTEAERVTLTSIAGRQPEPGLSPQQLADFYYENYLAAQRLGDVSKELDILPKWLAGVGDSVELQLRPTWLLWRAHMTGGDVAEGIRHAEHLLQLVSLNNYGLYRIRMLAALARNYVDLMDLTKAEELLQKAQSELNILKSRPGVQRKPYYLLRAEFFLQSARSRLLSQRGKHAEADALAREAVELAQKMLALQNRINDKDIADAPKFMYIMAMENLMHAQTAQGRLNDAAVTAQAMLRFFRDNRIGGSNQYSAYLKIASLKLAQNDLRRSEFYARAVLKEARPQAGQQWSKLAIYAQNRVQDVLLVKHAWSEAAQLQDELDAGVAGDELGTRMASRPLVRGVIYAYSGQQEKALALLKQSAERHASQFGLRHIDTILANGLYAIALAKNGRKEEALPLFARSVHDLHAPEIIGGEVADQGLQRAYRQLILEEFIALLAERPGDAAAIDQAFRVAEYLRGSVVEQSVVDSAVRAAAGIAGLSELVRAQQDMQNEISVLQSFLARQLAEPPQRQLPGIVEQVRNRIATLQGDLATRHRDITARFPEYDALIHPQPPSVAAIRKRLAANEAFISIVPLSNQVAILAVSSQGAAFAVAGASPAQLDALVKRLRATLDLGDRLGEGSLPYDADAAYRIYEAVLTPVGNIWNGKSQLSIAAGGALGQIPFSVLLTSPPQSTKIDTAYLHEAPWLVKQVSVSHVPSASSWAALRDTAHLAKAREATSKPFFGFGDPLFNLAQTGPAGITRKVGTVRKVALTRSAGDADLVTSAQYDRLPPLPETRDEIIAIATALGADPQRDAVFGKEASRKNVVTADLSKHKVIVFATHGLVAGDLPNLSQPALALAGTGSNTESPLLTLEDVLRLKLDADWIVLSACNTAAADGQAGEAISGLGRGFFYAGAKALLVTHWAVETQSAMELTTATFRRFGADSTLPRAEALRQAQLALIASPTHAHPFFWAPYALIGDGGR